MPVEFTDISSYHCLRWHELPDLALYMDQVLNILEKQLGTLACDPADKNLTSTMINNYVKHKVIPAPVKKRYEKEHLACLTMVCVAKQVLSLTEIDAMMRAFYAIGPMEQEYDLFCDVLEQSLRCTFGGEQPSACQTRRPDREMMETLAGAFANKLYLQRLLIEQDKEKKKKAE